ncbi:uncharacterized protein LOC130892834 isoform X1 [Diorhabda carinulata]|uniref:uncharacterized protein LOC130892834 isoform X1 n=2 Tax=Diorhabda carinulata TaxID=1163345 RepID=UPI0025A220EC|nr:uncharacterized protein LOC130892834 isoform X1 [Diorhabda carinulata]
MEKFCKSVKMDCEEKLKRWLKRLLNMDKLEKYNFIIEDNDDKCSGYMSRIFFITIKQRSGSPRLNIDLVVKIGTTVKTVGDTFKIDKFFLRENFMYNNIFPIFSKLEKEKNVDETFDSYPKYYGHLFLEDSQIIAFENIKKIGFKLCDRKIGMDLQHCKLVLKAYAQLHSLTFALKDQYLEIYNKITSETDDIFVDLMLSEHSKQYMQTQRDEVLQCLKEHDENELYENYKNEFENIVDTCIAILLDKDDQVVFLHGDNWNNNFMFKYEEGAPAAVSIVDWQLSSIRSPVFDISRFLFSVCRKKALDKLRELLKYYYDCFSDHLIKLGSDPEKLFSFSDFKRHWKKYSQFGIIGSSMTMKLAVLDETEAPSISQLECGIDYNDTFNIVLSGKELYYQRMKDAVTAYYEMKNDVNFLD